MSWMRSLFVKLVPPRDEISIFTMAVGLIAIGFADGNFRDSLSFVVIALLVEFPSKGFEASRFEGITYLYGGVMFVLVSAASVAASLYLPFTQRKTDLTDIVVRLVVLAHVIIICASNFLAFENQQNILSWFFTVTSFLYLMIFSFGFRFRLLTAVISDRQATARQAAIAAVSVTLLIMVLSLGLNMHWAHCYALAAGYAVVLAKFFDSGSI